MLIAETGAGGWTVTGSWDWWRRGAAAATDSPEGDGVGGDLAAGADGVLSAQGMDVLAIARVVPEVLRWPSAEVHPGPAAGGQEGRQVPPGGPWPAVFHLEPGQAGGVPGGWGGGRGHQPRGAAHAAAVGGHQLPAVTDLEGIQRPALCREEGPCRAPACDRRPWAGPGAGRAGGHLLPGQVRALEPAAPPPAAVGPGQRQEQTTGPCATASAARRGPVQARARIPPPVARLAAGSWSLSTAAARRAVPRSLAA